MRQTFVKGRGQDGERHCNTDSIGARAKNDNFFKNWNQQQEVGWGDETQPKSGKEILE